MDDSCSKSTEKASAVGHLSLWLLCHSHSVSRSMETCSRFVAFR